MNNNDKKIITWLLNEIYKYAQEKNNFDKDELVHLYDTLNEKYKNMDSTSNLQSLTSDILPQEKIDNIIYKAIDNKINLKYISIFTPLKYDYLKYASDTKPYLLQGVFKLVKMDGYDDELTKIFEGIDVNNLLVLSKDEYYNLLDKMDINNVWGAVITVDYIKEKIKNGEVKYLEYLSNKNDILNHKIRVRASEQEITDVMKEAIDNGCLTKNLFDLYATDSLNFSSLIYATKKFNIDGVIFSGYANKISTEPTEKDIIDIIDLGFLEIISDKFLLNKDTILYALEKNNVNSKIIEKNLLENKMSKEDKKEVLKYALENKKISFEFINQNLKNSLLNEEEYDEIFESAITHGYEINLNEFDYKYIKNSIENGNFSDFKYIVPQSFFKKKVHEFQVIEKYPNLYEADSKLKSLIDDIDNQKIKVISDEEYDELVYRAIDKGFDLSSVISSFNIGNTRFTSNYSKYLKYLIDKTDNIQSLLDYDEKKNINYSSISNNSVLIDAVEKGYIINPLSPSKILTSKFVKLGLLKNQVNNFFELPNNCLTADVVKLNSSIHGYDCVKKAIDDGYKISDTSPKIFSSLKYIEYAIEHGQPDAIDFCKTSIFAQKKLDKLVKLAIDNGYKMEYVSTRRILNLENITYSIEKGNGRSIDELSKINLKRVKEDKLDDLIKKAITSNYIYSIYSPDFMCKYEYYLLTAQQKATSEGKNGLFFGKDIDLKGLTDEQIDELIMTSIKSGLKIDYVPKSLLTNKHIQCAISMGSSDAILLMDFSKLTEEEKEKNIYMAIDNGYMFSKKTPKEMLENKNIMYAISKGQFDAITLIDFSSLTEEEKDKCIYNAIDKGYCISKNSPKEILENKYILYALERKKVIVENYLIQNEFNNLELSKLTDEQISSILTFISFQNDEKLIGFVTNIDDIYKFFDKSGITKEAIENFLDIEDGNEFDKRIFEKYYKDNFNVTTLNKLLNSLDGNYYYLIKFARDTLDMKIPLKEEDNEIINKKYCLDIIGYNNFIDLIKFIYYRDDKHKLEITNIIKNNELSKLMNIYAMICKDFNVIDLAKVVLNYNSNKKLLDDIYMVNDLTIDEKAKLYMLMINGDKSAAGIINSREDLKNYNEIIYNENKKIIDNSDITDIKRLIFKSLFNIDSKQVFKILFKFQNGSCINELYKQIENEELKNIVREYACILKFINAIDISGSLESLKAIASKINEIYKDNLDELMKIWEYFSKFDDNLMYILGEEINEKITNFDELLETNEEDIPMIDDEPLYNVSTLKLKNDFEYDNYEFNADSEVKMIELNGLPFVTFGHVLNAYESQYHGQLLDFNHPRVIGRTHLCVSAIDDNYYAMANNKTTSFQKGPDIDYIKLLFSEVPSENIKIASSQDAASYTSNNKLEIESGYSYGGYNPIRKTISETYYDSKGYYNEYTCFRNGIMPSAILIRGNEPDQTEIQAAAYLSKIRGKDIPLVKINKEKYPIKSYEEMIKRDEELQKTFYKEMYERKRRKIAKEINIEELRKMKNFITMYFSDTNENVENRKMSM